jgi:hypothetical protein
MHQNICPGHLKANTPFYVWANMSQAGWSAPDVILAENPETLRRQSPGCIEEFEAAGGLFIGIGHKPRSPSLQQASRDSATYEKNGWPYIDIHPMARPHYNNGRNDFTAKDIHYVHAGNCYGNGTASHVCSEVLEMEVFMLLHVMRQHPRLEWLNSIQCEPDYRRFDTKNLTLCMQCPKNMMKSMDTDPIQCTDHIPVGCLGGSQHLEGDNTSGQSCVAPSTRHLSLSSSTFLSYSTSTSPSALSFQRRSGV